MLSSWRRKNGSIHRVLDQRIVLRGREFHNFLIYRIIRDNVFCALLPESAPNKSESRPPLGSVQSQQETFAGILSSVSALPQYTRHRLAHTMSPFLVESRECSRWRVLHW